MSPLLSLFRHRPRPTPALSAQLHSRYHPLFPHAWNGIRNIERVDRAITNGRWEAFSVVSKPSARQRKADHRALRRHLKTANKISLKAFDKWQRHRSPASSVGATPNAYELRLRLNMNDWNKARRAESAINTIVRTYTHLLDEQHRRATERFGPVATGRPDCPAAQRAHEAFMHLSKRHVIDAPTALATVNGKLAE